MDALARLNPVKPPKVNRNKNPIAKRLHVVVLIAPVHKVNYGYRELKINLAEIVNPCLQLVIFSLLTMDYDGYYLRYRLK